MPNILERALFLALSAFFRNVALVVGGGIGIYLAYQRSLVADKQQRLAERGQITDRYSKAVEQLGNMDNVSVRIGGLYALQKVAKDSEEDLPTVQQVIANFIRHPPYQKEWAQMEEKIKNGSRQYDEYIDCPDIYVAFEVFHSFQAQNLPSLKRTKFKFFDLRQINFSDLDFEESVFSTCYIEHGNLQYCNLDSSSFKDCDLSFSNFSQSSISFCHFLNCTLQGSELSNTFIGWTSFVSSNLEETYLDNSDLSSTSFMGSNISKIDFSTSKNLEEDSIVAAWSWDDTKPTLLPPLSLKISYNSKDRDNYELYNCFGYPHEHDLT